MTPTSLMHLSSEWSVASCPMNFWTAYGTLVPGPGIEPGYPELMKVWSPNHSDFQGIWPTMNFNKLQNADNSNSEKVIPLILFPVTVFPQAHKILRSTYIFYLSNFKNNVASTIRCQLLTLPCPSRDNGLTLRLCQMLSRGEGEEKCCLLNQTADPGCPGGIHENTLTASINPP